MLMCTLCKSGRERTEQRAAESRKFKLDGGKPEEEADSRQLAADSYEESGMAGSGFARIKRARREKSRFLTTFGMTTGRSKWGAKLFGAQGKHVGW